MPDAKTITLTLKTVADISDVTSNIKQIQNALSQLKLPPELQGKFSKIFNDMENNVAKATNAINSGFKSKGNVTDFDNAMKRINADFIQLQQTVGKIDFQNIKWDFDSTKVQSLNKEIGELENKLSNLRTEQLEKIQEFSKQPPSNAKSWQNFIEQFKEGNFDAAGKSLGRLRTELDKAEKAKRDQTESWIIYRNAVKAYSEALEAMTSDTGEAAQTENQLIAKNKELEQEIERLRTELEQAYGKFPEQVGQAAQGTRDFGNAMGETAHQTNALGDELDQFKNRVAYFFGLNNAVQLFKRAVQSAFDTVKDLDAVMTETAVVTKFDVGDMWAQLPMYTQRANELGISIHDAYEAATLFYQQGLNTNQVMQVSNETLKMARIAGLDAADATDRMTNALRGFNMEINETTAKNINDVYSALAARTASNVDEISTAMTKVASLANNANMSFENTAAFLSQIIETTRESAETAGTALKTVIARFSEVKSLYSQGELMGDIEGEEINVNKVSAALRVAGINLNEYLTGMKGLDDIFMELASKWNTLDLTTQRYIATMAAGSRQQSRFIAMMSDYQRTQELVSIANNAAGESQQQFEKTLESLETKLAQLKNAWDTFLMGITDSTAIKFVVGVLTDLITIVDKATNALPGLGGSLTKVLTGIMLFKGGKALFLKLFANIKAGFAKAGTESGMAFKDKFTQAVNSNGGGMKGIAKATTLPFVNTLKTAFSKTVTQQIDHVKNALKQAGIEGEHLSENAKMLQQQLTSGQLSGEQLDQLIANLNLSDDAAKRLKAELQSIPTATEIVNKRAQAMASAFQGAGMALMMFSGILSNLGAPEGLTKIISLLGTGLMLVGTLIPVIKVLWDTFGQGAIRAGLKAQTAGWMANLSWGAFLTTILAITLAFVGLIAVITLIAKAVHQNSLTYQLEQAKEAASKAEEEAKLAKDAYDALFEDHNKYNELQKSLEEAQKGTREWYQLLRDSNQEVLDLIQKYSTLAQYTSFEDGRLIISEAGWTEAENLSRRRMVTANAGAAAANIRLQSFTTKVARDTFAKNLRDVLDPTSLSSAFNLDLAEAADIISARFLDNPSLWLSEDNLQSLADELGVTVESLKDAEDSIQEYTQTLSKANKETQTQLAALFGSTLSDTNLGYEFSSDIVNAISSNINGNQLTKAISDSLINYITIGHLSGGMAAGGIAAYQGGIKDSETYQRIAEEYNINMDTDLIGDNKNRKHDLRVIYAAMKGIELSQVDTELGEDQLELAIAQMDIMKQMGENIDDFLTRMQKRLSQTDQSDLAALITGQFGERTIDEMTDLTDDVDEQLKQFAQQLGYNTEKEMAEALGFQTMKFEDLSAEQQDIIKNVSGNAVPYIVEATDMLSATIQSQAKELKEAFKEATEILQGVGIRKEDSEKLSNTLVLALADQVESMPKAEGKAYAESVLGLVNKSGLNREQQASLGKLLSSTDLSDMRSMLALMDELRNMGVKDTEIKAFWDAATAGAKLYIKDLQEALSLTNLFMNQFKGNKELIDRLVEGKGTEQDVQALIDQGIDIKGILTLTVEGWQIPESERKNIERALQEANIEEAQLALDTFKEQIQSDKEIFGSGQTFQEFTSGNNNIFGGLGSMATLVDKLGIRPGDYGTTEDFLQALEAEYNSRKDAYDNQDVILKTLQDTVDLLTSTQSTAAELYSREDSTPEAVRWAAQNEITDMGGDVAEFNAMRQAIIDLNPYLEGQEKLVTMLALANTKLNTGLGQIIDSYDTWTELIDKDTGLIKASTSEDIAAFNELKKSVNLMLNTSQDLSKDFWNNAENMKALKKAAEGDVEAIEKLQKAASIDYLGGLKVKTAEGKQAIEAFSTYLNQIDLPQLEVGAKLDDQDFIKSCNEMIATAGLTKDQVSEMFRLMGFDAEITEETAEQTVEHHGTGSWSVGDISVPMSSDWKDEVTTKVPVVKTLTSTGSGGGGISFANKTAGAKNAGKGSGGGGGGSSEKPKYWDNKYDRLYNLQQEENSLLRERNRLEHEHNELLNGAWKTNQDIVDNYHARVDSLTKEAELQRQINEAARNKAAGLGSSIYEDSNGNRKTFDEWGVTGAVQIDWTNGTIQVDEEFAKAIENDPNRSDQGAALDAYVDKIQEVLDTMYESEESLWEIEQSLLDLRKEVLSNAADVYDQIAAALEKEQQDRIDELSAVNDAINEANSNILDAMQESIELERQIRDNTKKEEDIADKEARLAYLQRDTSGSNQLEIMQLQQELDDARSEYEDELVDQALDKLSNDNEKAAQQREMQIQTLEAQLQWWKDSGMVWQDVKNLVTETQNLQANGVELENTKFGKLLANDDPSQNPFTKALDKDALYKKWTDVIEGTDELNEEYIKGAYNDIKTKEDDIKKAVEGIEPGGNTTIVYNNASGSGSGGGGGSNGSGGGGGGKYPAPPETADPVIRMQAFIRKYNLTSDQLKRWGKLPQIVQDAWMPLTPEQKTMLYKWADEYWKGQGKGGGKNVMTAYATGGLSSTTGPAWLDGTPSKPEYVLNAEQTSAFLELVNALTGKSSALDLYVSRVDLMDRFERLFQMASGDNYFDIHIDAELDSDYAVDQLADRIKSQIVEDANYRNVQSINWLR